ncbi:MAG TPA: ATP-binding protein [Spirochaetia bacterium]|nr:ATP-binding protein [Spirochaetia bacterium]
MSEYNSVFDTAELNSGESVGCAVIEITAIPDISVLTSRFAKEEDTLNSYKAEIGSLLSELYQNYKQNMYQSGSPKDISYELLWVTESVKNQPYKAIIRLFIIVREIDTNTSAMTTYLSSLQQICCASLNLQKYSYRQMQFSELVAILGNVDTKQVRAIVKDERIDNLQNQILPQCYSFDRFLPSQSDLSRIVNSLIEYPNCAISLQLIPTQYTAPEATALGQVSQVLNTLSRGVSEQGMGNVSFAAAESLAENYKYYDNAKTGPLFSYNILIYGNEQAVPNISTRLFGLLGSSSGGKTGLRFVDLSEIDIGLTSNAFPLPWAVNEILVDYERSQTIFTTQQLFSNFYRLPFIITADEASEFFRLPIGSSSISAGISINESDKAQKTYTDNIINSGDIVVGKLKSSSQGDTIGFSLNDLAKHMLIVGTPGSGKTTFSVSLLDRLWKEHHIPFLVIEPAKNEYRALVQSIPELQVFTPGKNFISPFVYNPFVPPKNVKLETYKSTLKTAFAAAVSMTTPLDKIFEEAINNCYSDFRWLDTYTIDDKGIKFNIMDFVKCFQTTFDEIGYTGDAKNIGRAGVVRLNSLVNLFDNYSTIPIEDLLQKPTIIELAAIENSDQKALIISLLLLSILAYVNSNYIGEGGLKNVILLEEAHVLLDSGANAGQGDANPSIIAQGLVKRMLAEIRSYGVGIVIADQSPRKVSTDVVALTDMKLTFRLVEATDKLIIADSTNMSDTQAQRLSKLKPGEAFLFFNKLNEPEEVITPDYRLDNNISITLSDDGIRQLSTYWKGKQHMLRPYPQCQYCSSCQNTCDYSRRVLAREVVRRIFTKQFKPDSKDFNTVIRVFSNISKLIIDELNDEPLSPELFSCVKVHLWRKIKYGTRIPIREIQIENSLKK